MRSSTAQSVPSSVPSSTGPGANPAFTIASPSKVSYPQAATTGQAAGGAKPVQADSGNPKAWYETFAPGEGWAPENPRIDGGYPETLPGGQNANWVQGAIARGVVESDWEKGRPNVTFQPKSDDWTHTNQFTPNDIQSQDVNERGFINLHPNDRMDFFTLRGSDDPDNVTYWGPEASQLPDITPLAGMPGPNTPYPNRDVGGYAINNGGVGGLWTPQGTNSGYSEPSPPQMTSTPDSSYQPDPAAEYF